MLTGLLPKTVLDRWRGVAIAVASLALMLFFAMAAYQQVDFGVYEQMPLAVRSLIGVPPGADVASLAYSVIFSSYGALALSGLMIGIGSALIAAEEADGTMGVLLGNPISRRRVVVAKAGAMVGLGAVAVLLLWGAGTATPGILDVDVTGMQIGAFSVHFALSALFYGLLALAVGAWTGRRGVAAGAATGVMVASFVAVGLLPLVRGAEELVRLFPWYYLDGADPLLSGVHWGHAAILAAACTALFAAALVGIERRDLRARSVGATLLDRLRAHPLTRRVADRLAGSARVSRIWVKTTSEHQGVLVLVGTAMFWLMGVALGPLYSSIAVPMADMGETFPESLLVLFGGGDLTTPAGFYQIETFGMVAPIAILVVTISMGARALAGEEERRTMALLLANPVPRRRVVLEKALAMVLFGFVVGLVTFAGVAVGSALGGLGIPVANIAATSLLATLVSLVFGALALLLSAATGLARVATLVPVGAALGSHVMNALAELDGAAWGRLSPFHYYLGSDPLQQGLAWGDAALLGMIVVVLLALAVPAFERRDLRQTA